MGRKRSAAGLAEREAKSRGEAGGLRCSEDVCPQVFPEKIKEAPKGETLSGSVSQLLLVCLCGIGCEFNRLHGRGGIVLGFVDPRRDRPHCSILRDFSFAARNRGIGNDVFRLVASF